MLRSIDLNTNNEVHKFLKQLVARNIMSNTVDKKQQHDDTLRLKSELLQATNGETYLLSDILEADPSHLKYLQINFRIRDDEDPHALLHISEIPGTDAETQKKLVHNAFVANLLIDIHLHNQITEIPRCGLTRLPFLYPVTVDTEQDYEMTEILRILGSTKLNPVTGRKLSQSQVCLNKAAHRLLLTSYHSLLRSNKDDNIDVNQLRETIANQIKTIPFLAFIHLNYQQLQTLRGVTQRNYFFASLLPGVSLVVSMLSGCYALLKINLLGRLSPLVTAANKIVAPKLTTHLGEKTGSLIFPLVTLVFLAALIIPFSFYLLMKLKDFVVDRSKRQVAAVGNKLAELEFVSTNISTLNFVAQSHTAIIRLLKITKPKMNEPMITSPNPEPPTAALLRMRPLSEFPRSMSKNEVQGQMVSLKR